jgi:hypothetical protein
MSGGDEISLELSAVGPELAELEPGVADDAGIRRASGQIFIGEIVNDPVEFTFEIKSIERNAKAVGYAAGVSGVLSAAAAFLVRGAIGFRLMSAGAHEEADHLVALFFQQVRGNGAIHSAAHGQYNSARHAHHLSTQIAEL